MAAARDRATAEPKDWHGTPVPDEVYHALTTTWRGQTGIAAKQAVVLRFFDEKAVLKGAGQQELTGGGGELGGSSADCDRKRGHGVPG